MNEASATTSVQLAVREAAEIHGARPALTLGDRVQSFAQTHERALRLAGALESLGCEPGSRVGIMATNGPWFVELYFAVCEAGMIEVPINLRFTTAELVHLPQPRRAGRDHRHAGSRGERTGDPDQRLQRPHHDRRRGRSRPRARLRGRAGTRHAIGASAPRSRRDGAGVLDEWHLGQRQGGSPHATDDRSRVPAAHRALRESTRRRTSSPACRCTSPPPTRAGR